MTGFRPVESPKGSWFWGVLLGHWPVPQAPPEATHSHVLSLVSNTRSSSPPSNQPRHPAGLLVTSQTRFDVCVIYIWMREVIFFFLTTLRQPMCPRVWGAQYLPKNPGPLGRRLEQACQLHRATGLLGLALQGLSRTLPSHGSPSTLVTARCPAVWSAYFIFRKRSYEIIKRL